MSVVQQGKHLLLEDCVETVQRGKVQFLARSVNPVMQDPAQFQEGSARLAQQGKAPVQENSAQTARGISSLFLAACVRTVLLEHHPRPAHHRVVPVHLDKALVPAAPARRAQLAITVQLAHLQPCVLLEAILVWALLRACLVLLEQHPPLVKPPALRALRGMHVRVARP